MPCRSRTTQCISSRVPRVAAHRVKNTPMSQRVKKVELLLAIQLHKTWMQSGKVPCRILHNVLTMRMLRKSSFTFSVPSGVRAPVADSTGGTYISLAWQEPDFPNGILTGYFLYQEDRAIYNGGQTMYNVTGLAVRTYFAQQKAHAFTFSFVILVPFLSCFFSV